LLENKGPEGLGRKTSKLRPNANGGGLGGMQDRFDLIIPPYKIANI
jgi:hypothetical protein